MGEKVEGGMGIERMGGRASVLKVLRHGCYFLLRSACPAARAARSVSGKIAYGCAKSGPSGAGTGKGAANGGRNAIRERTSITAMHVVLWFHCNC